MKNHWLDNKINKEITSFIDLSTAMNKDGPNTRYKEYDRLVENKQYDILTSTDKEDREMVKAILLKNYHKTHWIEEILGDIQYTPHLAPGCDLTIGQIVKENPYKDWPPRLPNGEIDVDTMKGKCDVCGEYEWPMNTEDSITQGDPVCACHNSCGNLDILYPSRFVQNETLQVLSDNGYITVYQVMYTPVLPGTMSGYICLDGECPPRNGFSFTVSEAGDFDVQLYGEWAKERTETTLFELAESEPIITYYDEIWNMKLNCTTGVLELYHHTVGKTPTVVVSYEYNKECEI